MSRAMPNSESIPIVLGLLRREAASARGMTTDGETVALLGSPIVKVKGRDEGGRPTEIEINLSGWGDTRTTRNCINSVLCRLGISYRVGLHKSTVYLYLITQGADSDHGSPVPITTLPDNGWITIPR